MNPLPVRILRYPAESPASYYSRLCAANCISEHVMWRSLFEQYPQIGTAVRPRSAPELVEFLGGLPPRSFVRRRGEFVSMCRHDPTLWVRACAFCNGTYLGLASLCRRCTAGELVLVERLAGPICVKHARWHTNGLDIDISGRAAQLNAQRRLNRWLHPRAIGHRTALAGVARDVVNSWWHPRNRSKDQLSLRQEIEGLPCLVDVLCALASPRMTELLDTQVTGRALAGVLIRMSYGVASGLDSRALAKNIVPVYREDGSPDRSLPEEHVLKLIARSSTIRGGLGRHLSRWSDRVLEGTRDE